MMTEYSSIEQILDGIEDGATIHVGGFGMVGTPESLIQGLRDKGTRNLTIISNNCGSDNMGLGLLLIDKQISKIICSYVGENVEFQRQSLAGELELVLVPQGTMIERIRAAGAGIPAFYSQAGVGTPIAEGRETRNFNGKEYLLETALEADFALVKAWRGDRMGNLIYHLTARNFNPTMATAAKVTIAEVEELVEINVIPPDQVHTPGIYVQRMIECRDVEKPIERRTVRMAKGV
jgi:3-oxoacid CoA-transferase subunit A